MNDYQSVERGPKSGMKIRYIILLTLAAFIGGGILAAWTADRLGYFSTTADTISDHGGTPVTAEPAPGMQSAPPFSANNAAAAPAAIGPVAERVEDLEARLSRINSAAAEASGNAIRAEAMLVAYAARRAIESGAALGYIENQLRTRFGAVQPDAVNQIAKAAQNPVTLDLLRQELESQSNIWIAPGGLSSWERVKREMSELFVLRNADTPSPAPSRRLQRAKQYTEVGNIKAALAEVENLPGAEEARGWVGRAKAYIQVRKALDMVERTALAQAPVAIPSGTQVTAPLSPAPAPTSAPTTAPASTSAPAPTSPQSGQELNSNIAQ